MLRNRDIAQVVGQETRSDAETAQVLERIDHAPEARRLDGAAVIWDRQEDAAGFHAGDYRATVSTIKSEIAMGQLSGTRLTNAPPPAHWRL